MVTVAITTALQPLTGDFHFLWECLKVLLMMFWGSPTHTGSLCNPREFVCRVQVELQVPMLGILYLTPSIAWHPESLCMSAGLLQVSTCGNIEFKAFVVVLH